MSSWENPSIETLEQLASEAEEALKQAAESGDFSSVDQKLSEFDTAYKAAEKKLNPFEKLLNLAAQYEGQKEILKKAGIPEVVAGKSCPTLEQVRDRLLATREVFERKIEQGFTKLLIVPFGLSVEDLRQKYGHALKVHAAAGKLFAEDDPHTPLDLDTATPVWKSDGYDNKTMVYFPTAYNRDQHGGLTKQEAVEKEGAWHIYLVEETPIPREEKGKELGKRKQLEANLKPTEYLEKITTEEAYKNESGFTPELWLLKALTRLEEKNEVIDDYRGKGSINYNLGVYFPGSADVSCAFWYRDNRKAVMDRSGVSDRHSGYGASSAVRV